MRPLPAQACGETPFSLDILSVREQYAAKGWTVPAGSACACADGAVACFSANSATTPTPAADLDNAADSAAGRRPLAAALLLASLLGASLLSVGV